MAVAGTPETQRPRLRSRPAGRSGVAGIPEGLAPLPLVLAAISGNVCGRLFPICGLLRPELSDTTAFFLYFQEALLKNRSLLPTEDALPKDSHR